jgi:hypothetical protein
MNALLGSLGALGEVSDFEPQAKECATLSGRRQSRYCRTASSILGRWRSVPAECALLLGMMHTSDRI